MAVTKIHPIEKTLHLALNYVMNENKTDEKILISSFGCNPQTAHLEFEQTKRECNSKAKILARHLIQSFAPRETTPLYSYVKQIVPSNVIHLQPILNL